MILTGTVQNLEIQESNKPDHIFGVEMLYDEKVYNVCFFDHSSLYLFTGTPSYLPLSIILCPKIREFQWHYQGILFNDWGGDPTNRC